MARRSLGELDCAITDDCDAAARRVDASRNPLSIRGDDVGWESPAWTATMVDAGAQRVVAQAAVLFFVVVVKSSKSLFRPWLGDHVTEVTRAPSSLRPCSDRECF